MIPFMFWVVAVGASAPAQPPDAAPAALSVAWHIPLRNGSFGGGAAADVDDDGRLEIAFATYFGDSAVHVLNGEDGTTLWKHQGGGPSTTAECLDASLKFTDINADGKLELIVPVSNSSQVLAFDAATGQRLWTYEAGPGECIDTPPWVGDADADGKPDIVVGTFKGKLHVIRAGDGTAVRTVPIAPGAVQSCPIVMDLNADGAADYVGANFNGDHRVCAVDGATGKELWHVQTGGSIYHGPSVGDLDGDGAPDMAVGSYDGKIHAFRARDGSSLWAVNPPGERYFMAPTAIADIDADGKPEVIATSDSVTVLRADGAIAWSQRIDKPGPWYGASRGVAIADLDGDGGPDLAAVNGRGRFVAFRGRDGHLLYEFEGDSVHTRSVLHGSSLPVIADLTGDGKVDVFFVIGGTYPENDRHGRAICITGFAGPARNHDGSPNGWFMHRHDALNTGNVTTPLDPLVVRAVLPR